MLWMIYEKHIDMQDSPVGEMATVSIYINVSCKTKEILYVYKIIDIFIHFRLSVVFDQKEGTEIRQRY